MVTSGLCSHIVLLFWPFIACLPVNQEGISDSSCSVVKYHLMLNRNLPTSDRFSEWRAFNLFPDVAGDLGSDRSCCVGQDIQQKEGCQRAQIESSNGWDDSSE